MTVYSPEGVRQLFDLGLSGLSIHALCDGSGQVGSTYARRVVALQGSMVTSHRSLFVPMTTPSIIQIDAGLLEYRRSDTTRFSVGAKSVFPPMQKYKSLSSQRSSRYTPLVRPLQAMSTPQIAVQNLTNSRVAFQLDNPPRFSSYMSVVAALFGGDDAMSAMAAIYVRRNRRLLVCDPSPTSLPNGVHMDPMALFELDDRKGPRFRAVHSGTVVEETGYLAKLFMKECATLEDGKLVPGRRTNSIRITVADLTRAPASQMNPTYCSAITVLFASIPISVSIGSCTLCAVRGDWYASSSILVGIIASGASHLVLGSADFVFSRPELAKGSLPGDGILGSDKDMVVLRGSEGVVNSITRGKFSLRFPNEERYHLVRSCSVLFIQSIIQLLLMPHASLFGHLMFLTSLGVSALYNAWLSLPDKETVHRTLLFDSVLRNPTLTKYTIGSRPGAVVFVLLVLQPQNPMSLLNEFFPGDNKVWNQWKDMVLEQLCHPSDQSFLSESRVAGLDGFKREEKDLLQLLCDDARAAYVAYRDYLGIDLL